jgi:hypothetical protein
MVLARCLTFFFYERVQEENSDKQVVVVTNP